ncbi:glutamic acid-rich protein-like [Panonychus citri]|uniref:glutamic acid-rich protein-like n=1 Tax=Panonychus citri TaxID=50023 RepID=UPI002307922B|nr:glutamic acid-rich protein-like [Panonychus citri]
MGSGSPKLDSPDSPTPNQSIDGADQGDMSGANGLSEGGHSVADSEREIESEGNAVGSEAEREHEEEAVARAETEAEAEAEVEKDVENEVKQEEANETSESSESSEANEVNEADETDETAEAEGAEDEDEDGDEDEICMSSNQLIALIETVTYMMEESIRSDEPYNPLDDPQINKFWQ